MSEEQIETVKVALFCKYCGACGKAGTIEADWPFIQLSCPGCGGTWKINNNPRNRAALRAHPTPPPDTREGTRNPTKDDNDRDKIWCAAILSVGLDLREVEKITSKAIELRENREARAHLEIPDHIYAPFLKPDTREGQTARALALRYLVGSTQPLTLEPGSVYHEFYHDPEGSIPGAYNANFYLWCIKKARKILTAPAVASREGGADTKPTKGHGAAYWLNKTDPDAWAAQHKAMTAPPPLGEGEGRDEG